MTVASTKVMPDLGVRVLVMGILNVTPDSFSDGGAFNEAGSGLEQGVKLAEQGADIIDIGGESTRPGATEVSAADEQARVIPTLTELAKRVSIPISIDTYKASTARAALEAGASIVNDVWGLTRDPDVGVVAADFNAPLIIMHNRREVDRSLDIIEEFHRFFERSIAIARRAGIPDRDIILDPGIGFGKTRAQNIAALARLSELKALGFPVLVGTSRKSLIAAEADRQPVERLPGTIASNVLAIAQGADIVRVHDVREHVDACRVAQAILDCRK